MKNSEKTNKSANTGLTKYLMQSNEIMMLIVLLLVISFFTFMNRNYLSYFNMTNILLAASTVGLLAIGETCLIIAGHIDLASASVAALFGTWVAILINAGVPWPIASLVVVVASVSVGLVNSCLVNIFGLQPFIATLAISSVCSGLAFIICKGKSVPINEEMFIKFGTMKIAGIPFPAILLIVFFIIFGFILGRTVFGRSVYMIGGNPTAACLAGLNPKKISTILYIISAMVAAFAGVLMTAKMHSGQPGGGAGAEFDAITAAILGGVAFSGGKGNLRGCFIGLLIMQCFNNGLTVISVSAFWQIVAKGLILIAALIFDFFRRERLER
ncbi:ABC transporter permease [Sediminispirochaeta smaragdinae]|jgi:ribose transport system permease protein|uniref:Inner-membrane translocator n=1 Tax=Sediminispirochaeta smaragdinae (strain DSM 11293 / JCM 15392 / SEBR 4228) TaxID=573413 RepID=E1R4U4_SEDSS|nr:ABC transporter permease [Sediminispirochaeta smaragdinae]ADK82182.1 inner-membrane translocator [Sediminispirochaeta smaragdinae DSM 11293]